MDSRTIQFHRQQDNLRRRPRRETSKDREALAAEGSASYGIDVRARGSRIEPRWMRCCRATWGSTSEPNARLIQLHPG